MSGDALFDLPPSPPPPAPRQRPRGKGAPVWSRYRPTRPVKCDHCVRVLVETNGTGPVAQSARFRRKTETTDEVLCYEHANAQRGRDDLPTFRAPRP